MLELVVAEADEELFGDQLIFGEVLEDEGDILWMYDNGEFESSKEVFPGIEDNLIVVFLFCEG